MRIVFMGTPDFAVPTLDALHAGGHEVAAVYTQPPRPAGRGKAPTPSRGPRPPYPASLRPRVHFRFIGPLSFFNTRHLAVYAFIISCASNEVARAQYQLPFLVAAIPTRHCISM